jgi:hypothetical protein
MCHLVNLNVNGRTVRVADIKKDYIENIMSSIYLCNMLYFDSSKPHNDIILNDINKGEVLFERI